MLYIFVTGSVRVAITSEMNVSQHKTLRCQYYFKLECFIQLNELILGYGLRLLFHYEFPLIISSLEQ